MIFYFSISFLYISLLFSPVKMEINFAESDADSLDKNSFFIFSLIFENGFGLFWPSNTTTNSPLRLIFLFLIRSKISKTLPLKTFSWILI